MSVPAPLAGPTASVDARSTEALRGASQALRHAITFAVPALESVRARITGETGALLADVICDLRAALTENGNPT